MAERPLNLRQAKFVRAYLDTANCAEAARQAGYAGTAHSLAASGRRLIHHPVVERAIEAAKAKIERQGIAGRQEALEVASAIMRDPAQRAADRLDAIGRLAKMEGWDRQQADGAQVQVATGVQVVLQGGTGDGSRQAEVWQMIHAMRVRRQRLSGAGAEEEPCRET